MLHRISRLNAPASVDYKRLWKAYNMNTKSEKGAGVNRPNTLRWLS